MKPQFFLLIAIVILSACASPAVSPTPQAIPIATYTKEATATPAIAPLPTVTLTPEPPDTKEHFIYSVAWSPNGTRIAMQVFNGIEIYDANSLELVSTIKTSIQDYKFISDGKELATSGNNDALEMWEVESGKPLQTIKFEMGITNPFALSRDKELLVTSMGSERCNCIYLLNTKTGQVINTFKEKPEHYPYCSGGGIEFLQQDKVALNWRLCTDIHIWQIENNQEIFSKHQITSANRRKWIVSVSTAPKANLVAILFNPIPGASDHTPLETRTLTPSPQPEIPEIVIYDLNKQVQEVFPQINSLLRNTSNSFESYIRKLQFSQDEKMLILSSYGQIFFWDINNDRLVRKIEIDGFESIYNPNGTEAILVRSKNNRRDTIEIWDTQTGKIIKTKTR